MLKIIVTGGAGFIGSAVIRHLINDTNHIVINLDKLTYAGNLESLVEIENSDRYFFEKVDVCDEKELKRVFEQHQPNIIMHLAAESHVDRSIDGPGEFIKTNVVGTYVLLEQARDYYNKLKKEKKNNFRFHHISTDEVYGDLPHPEDFVLSENKVESTVEALTGLPLFTESTSYNPSSPYSASKASSDHLVRAWHRTYGLPIVITNCSNNYGPYHFPEKLIPLIILNALEGQSLPVYGRGNQIRDWLFVEDHAKALVLVATQGKVSETYNIGGHNEKQNIEVVHKICELLEELAPEKPAGVINYKDLMVYVKDRAGHDARYAIDASKIQRDLGWVPKESFETGMRKTVTWYLSNRDWCRHVQDGSYQRERLGNY